MDAGQAVLVTGGAGYIGSHACKALRGRGYLPVALDSLANGHAEFAKWGPLVVGDIGDEQLVSSVVRQYGVRAVLHFAALAEVEQSMRDPVLYYENNVAKSVGLIEALRGAGVDRLIFSSSCSVYGVPERSPIAEELGTNPISPYGESKLAIENLLRACDHAYGLRSVSLRYFNAAGADPQGEIGERPRAHSRLIPRAIEAALGLRPEVAIFGDDYSTRDGTAVRDYVHVEDVVDAHLSALDYLDAGAASTVLNLGAGIGHSVREVIVAVERITGRRIPTRIAPRRPGDPPELIASIYRAAELLNWRPRRSNLDTIIGSALAWQCGKPAEGVQLAGERPD
ncbi:MAG TPA: UDP-glucose 4-epimerase GalE [Alphaproteobacteria bacterium]|nr:UDP-glucose 4-epimerase GalE [Alphaproteobacteria bacterium]